MEGKDKSKMTVVFDRSKDIVQTEATPEELLAHIQKCISRGKPYIWNGPGQKVIINLSKATSITIEEIHEMDTST